MPDSVATVSSCEDATIAASPEEVMMMDLDEDDDNHNNNILDTAFCAKNSSALKLLQQQELSSTSEQDLSWIAEPLQYKKNLVGAFELAEAAGDDSVGSMMMMMEEEDIHQNNNKNSATITRSSITDPTPSKATVQAKIARFEQKTVQGRTSSGDHIAVYLRTRPTTDPSAPDTIEVCTATTGEDSNKLPRRIRTHAPASSNAAKFVRPSSSRSHAGTGGAAATTVTKEYEFTGVFDGASSSSSQQVVYETTVQPQLAGLLGGESALVFCYGITNAGKTYTVSGGTSSASASFDGATASDDEGLVPRAVRDLWRICDEVDEELQLSYFEIYNEQQYDLLVSPCSAKGSSSMFVFGNSSNNDVSRHTVTSVQDGLQQIAVAQKHRRSGANGINACSSRSHAVCQLSIGSTHLWIVDLAGSERAKRTSGRRWQEAVQINKSLMTLNRCLMALRHSSSSLAPPYRESKLTQLFGQHWTSRSASRTVMIVNVNPAAADFDETQHALAYASAAKTVRVGSSGAAAAIEGRVAMEYGYDGRRRPVSKTTVAGSCLKTIKAVVQKLSPKRNTNNKRKQQSSTGAKQRPQSSKRVRLADHSHVESTMHRALLEAQTETDTLKKDYQELSNRLHTVEKKVRSEVVDEMDGKMRAMKLQSEASAKKEEKSKEIVQDLLETIEECEGEMERMREVHVADLTRHKSKYERILREKNLELHQKEACLHQLEKKVEELQLEVAKRSNGYEKHAEQQRELQEQVERLKQDIEEILASKIKHLQEKDECIESLEGHVKMLQQELDAHKNQSDAQKATLCNEIEQLTNELVASRAEAESLRGDQDLALQQQSLQPSWNNSENEKPRCTRHQIKHQEVVDIQAPKNVLGNLALNRQDSTSSSSSSDGSFGPSKWLKPRRMVRKDPNTGMYPRPRGRPPNGVSTWDETRGEWRLSNAQEK